MIHRKRIHALARSSLAASIAIALGACSASTYPTPAAQIPNDPTPQSDTAAPGSMLPEVVVTAPRLRSPRVAEETSSRPPAKRGS
jgi:hypothetical protein